MHVRFHVVMFLGLVRLNLRSYYLTILINTCRHVCVYLAKENTEIGDIPMYKHTVIFYPHIVKQYETIDQFVSENGYDDYIAAVDYWALQPYCYCRNARCFRR